MMTYTMKSLGEVFAQIQALRGYDNISMGAAERTRCVGLINQAGKTAWMLRMWPEFTAVERRTYRPSWSSTESYSTGNEVWRLSADGETGHYYRALQTSLDVDPQDNAEPTYWEEDPSDMRLYIAFEQPWEATPIGKVDITRFATWDDPTFVMDPSWVRGLRLWQRCVVFPAPGTGLDQGQASSTSVARGMPARPWVQFLPPWPEVSEVLWDAGEAVAAGTLRYRTQTGECYLALRPSTGAVPEESADDWATRGVPEFFFRYICLSACAQRQSEEEGKYKTLQAANDELEALETAAIVDAGIDEGPTFVAR
jgi:hypothetical protein